MFNAGFTMRSQYYCDSAMDQLCMIYVMLSSLIGPLQRAMNTTTL